MSEILKYALLMTFLVMAGMVLASNSAFATAYSRQYCVNDTVLYTEDAVYNADTGELTHYNETFICNYGCHMGHCLPYYQDISNLPTIIGFMMIAFFFLYAGLKMDKNTHGVIQVLFLFAGMLFVILTASIVTESASFSGVGAVEAAANSGYALTIYIFWFVMFWFIVLLLYKVLVMIGVIKPLKWGV